MNVMKKILTIVVTLVCLTTFAQDKMINDKNAEVRNVPGFNAIKVSGGINIYLSQSQSEAVAVSASEEKYRDRIKTEVVNDVLKIYVDNEKFNWNLHDKKLRAYISFKNLNSLRASGASDIKATNVINVPSLNLSLSGASDFEGSVNITDLAVDLSGASDVKIEGVVKNIKIDASGASDVKGYGLIADDCTADISGASDIYITVNKQISARASGASSVYYKGEAVVKEVHTSGASSISKKG